MQSLGAERGRLSLVFAIVLFDAVLMLLSPYLLGKSIDAMAGKEATLGFFFMTICALVIAYLADGLLTLLQGWIMAGLSQRIVANLRDTLFGKLQKLPVAYFDSHTHGEMMSRLTNDIDNVSTSISQSITQLMAGLIILMGSFVMMLVLSPILAFATLLTVPLVFLLTRTIAGKTNRLFKEQQAELGRLNGHIEESISGLQVIKAFNHEDQVIDEFAAINERLYKVGLHAQIWSGFLMPILNVINNLGFAVVAIVGGILAVKGMITVGVIASFLSYSRQFVRPLNEMANIFNLLQSGVAGAERVFDVLDEREEPDDTPDAVTLTQPRGHVAFEHVSFGYHDDQPILHDISFEAKAGSRIALVGPTGAGKTTIIILLARL
jgi:ATP-binding cassette subfamily B protein